MSQRGLIHCGSSVHHLPLSMEILMNLALAGLLLPPQYTQAKNIQAKNIQSALSANIAGDVTQESLLVENSQGFGTTLHVNHISPLINPRSALTRFPV
jgi:hypothetical protein